MRGREGFEVRSAGTLMGAPTTVSRELIQWAEIIFVMEDHHREALRQLDQGVDKKTVVLGIGDNYLKGDPELTRILKERLSKYLGES